jgi:hypothetical protein
LFGQEATMRFDRRIPIWVLSGALAGAVAGSAQAAGAVEVSFIEPAHYTDAGRNPSDVRSNEVTLEQFIRNLGKRYLADGQVLKIDVLDVDLAGTVRPARGSGLDLRIVRGSADMPHIRLRYALTDGGVVVKTAEETLTDLNYARHTSDYATSDPLRHEKRMLSDWFKANFVSRKSAAR